MKTLFTPLLVLLMVAQLGASNQEIVADYNFNRPRIVEVTIGDVQYHRIVLENAPNGGYIGEPALPAYGVQLLLPHATEVANIEIQHDEAISLGSGYLIEPVAKPVPLSWNPGESCLPVPNPEIYSMHTSFPAQRSKNIGTQIFRGYQILILKLSPVEYIPKSGEIRYYPNLRVVVSLAPSPNTPSTYRGFQEDLSALDTRVDNPELAATYMGQPQSGTRDYGMLIITTPDFAGAFQPIKDYHDTTGLPTEIRTTADIGSNDPDDIRDYISAEYQSSGIQYVLIGADDDIIPAKDLYVITDTFPSALIEYEMPGDIYFACLDGTYNYDGDEYWGEPTDGEGGGDVDLTAEVYVGRICARSSNEATNQINKTIQYLASTSGYLDTILLVGERMSFSGWGEYAGYSLDELVDYSDHHGYTTIGFPSTICDINKLYDLTWPDNDWPKTELAARINAGKHVVNHFGHTNSAKAMKMTLTDMIIMLNNTDYFFVYSQGCFAGQFDGIDCPAEYMTVKSPHAAFAAVMNARFGWGTYGTDGTSHRYNREFWDAVYNPAENKTSLGEANHDSKEDNLYRIDEPAMRWNYYQLTLFGDPAVRFHLNPGLTFEYPNGIPGQVLPEQAESPEVTVSGICGGEAVSGSGQMHYVINGGDIQSMAMTEIATNHYVTDLPLLACGDILEIYFSAEEGTRGRFYYPDPEMPHVITVVTDTILIFEDDFETDKGWTTGSSVWQRGLPLGLGGSDCTYGGQDPDDGYLGPNVYGYNLSGDYTNNLDEKHLFSPIIDCSGRENIHLKFRRWLGVDVPAEDHASIKCTTDGVNWTTIWFNQSAFKDNEWVEIDIDLSAQADNQPDFQLCWTMGPTNDVNRCCGWNIDYVRLISLTCATYICGDANGDDVVNVSDAVHIINYVFVGGDPPEPLIAGDCNCDLTVNVSDAVWIINYVFVGGNSPCDTDGNGIPDC